MKVTLETEDTIVTIEDKNAGGHMARLSDLFRRAALAVSYHPDTVEEYIPDTDY